MFLSVIADYSQLDFREELVMQLGGIGKEEEVPLYQGAPTFPAEASYYTEHLPVALAKNLNCKVCYKELKIEKKAAWKCSAAVCYGAPLCLTGHRNCFSRWHSAEYNGKH
jgi:hypothetical protein